MKRNIVFYLTLLFTTSVVAQDLWSWELQGGLGVSGTTNISSDRFEDNSSSLSINENSVLRQPNWQLSFHANYRMSERYAISLGVGYRTMNYKEGSSYLNFNSQNVMTLKRTTEYHLENSELFVPLQLKRYWTSPTKTWQLFSNLGVEVAYLLHQDLWITRTSGTLGLGENIDQTHSRTDLDRENWDYQRLRIGGFIGVGVERNRVTASLQIGRTLINAQSYGRTGGVNTPIPFGISLQEPITTPIFINSVFEGPFNADYHKRWRYFTFQLGYQF